MRYRLTKEMSSLSLAKDLQYTLFKRQPSNTGSRHCLNTKPVFESEYLPIATSVILSNTSSAEFTPNADIILVCNACSEYIRHAAMAESCWRRLLNRLYWDLVVITGARTCIRPKEEKTNYLPLLLFNPVYKVFLEHLTRLAGRWLYSLWLNTTQLAVNIYEKAYDNLDGFLGIAQPSSELFFLFFSGRLQQYMV